MLQNSNISLFSWCTDVWVTNQVGDRWLCDKLSGQQANWVTFLYDWATCFGQLMGDMSRVNWTTQLWFLPGNWQVLVSHEQVSHFILISWGTEALLFCLCALLRCLS